MTYYVLSGTLNPAHSLTHYEDSSQSQRPTVHKYNTLMVLVLGARIIMSESGGRGDSNDPANC